MSSVEIVDFVVMFIAIVIIDVAYTLQHKYNNTSLWKFIRIVAVAVAIALASADY
jgi:hypothetical protein